MLPDGMMLVRNRGSFDISAISRNGTPRARTRIVESGGNGGGPVK